MSSRNTKFYSFILVLADVFFLLAAFVGAYIIRVQYDPRPLLSNVYAMEYLGATLLIIPFWVLVFALLGLYQPTVYNRRLSEWGRIGVGSVIGILIVIGWQYVSGNTMFPARLVAVYSLIGSFALIVAERELLRFIRDQLFRYGKGVRRVLLIGSSKVVDDIADILSDTSKSGYQIVATAGPRRVTKGKLRPIHYSSLDAALKDIKANSINTIIQTDLYESAERNQRILARAQAHHIEYSFIPGETEFYSGKNTIDVFLGYPMITVYQTPLVGWGAIVKRLFDLAFIIITSPVWIPVFLLLILAQKIFNPGPAFFVNVRLGRYGKKINILKFRSMIPKYSGQDAIKIFEDMGRHDLAETYAKTRKVDNDPRITRFGKFLRATSLDELPQIINVLRGEMSLVGPRPILPDEKHFYKDHGSLLFSVKPGLSGLWQVSGRSDMPFEQRVELELYYAQNWSFWLDIKILFKTLLVVIRRNGAR